MAAPPFHGVLGEPGTSASPRLWLGPTQPWATKRLSSPGSLLGHSSRDEKGLLQAGRGWLLLPWTLTKSIAKNNSFPESFIATSPHQCWACRLVPRKQLLLEEILDPLQGRRAQSFLGQLGPELVPWFPWRVPGNPRNRRRWQPSLDNGRVPASQWGARDFAATPQPCLSSFCFLPQQAGR